MSAYPKKYISVNEALSILKSAQDSNPENERWYSEVLLFSLKDDSEQSKVKSGPRTKKTNMRIGGQNGCKYLDVKLKYKATYIPFNLTTSNLDSYGNTMEDEFDICLGGIKPPAGSAEFEELKAKNPNAEPRPGDKDVVMFLNEYDKNILEADEEGNPVLPEGTKRSKLFEVLSIVSAAIANDMRISVTNGKDFIRFIKAKRTENKSISGTELIELYDSEYPTIRANNLLLLSNEDKNEIQRGIHKDDLKVILNEVLILEPKLTPNLCVSGDYYSNGDLALNKYTKIKLMCSGSTGEIICPIIDIKKSDENNRETLASITNEDGEDEPITISNIHRYIVRKSLVQGNYVTEISITKAGFSFTAKCSDMSVDINNSINKEVVAAPSLWVSKTAKKSADSSVSTSVKFDINDDDSTDGAFDPIPNAPFGIDSEEINLNDAFDDSNSIKSDNSVKSDSNDEN